MANLASRDLRPVDAPDVESTPPDPLRTQTNGLERYALLAISVVMGVAALKLAQGFFVPIAFCLGDCACLGASRAASAADHASLDCRRACRLVVSRPAWSDVVQLERRGLAGHCRLAAGDADAASDVSNDSDSRRGCAVSTPERGCRVAADRDRECGPTIDTTRGYAGASRRAAG